MGAPKGVSCSEEDMMNFSPLGGQKQDRGRELLKLAA